MPRNAYQYCDPADMPLDMQLDLLVDGELPDSQRRELLLAMQREPAQWRDLSLRFLERQTEKKSVQQLINRGSIFPADSLDIPPVYKFPGLAWMTPGHLRGIAAGLLIATASALITIYVVNRSAPLAPDQTVDVINANLPGRAVGMDRAVAVQIPMVNTRADRLFSPADRDRPSPRRSVIIQPDGTGNAVVIPVNTLPMKVY